MMFKTREGKNEEKKDEHIISTEGLNLLERIKILREKVTELESRKNFGELSHAEYNSEGLFLYLELKTIEYDVERYVC